MEDAPELLPVIVNILVLWNPGVNTMCWHRFDVTLEAHLCGTASNGWDFANPYREVHRVAIG